MKIKSILIFLLSAIFCFYIITSHSLASENTGFIDIDALKNYSIISEYNEDVTGDNIKDRILLLAINLENTNNIKSSIYLVKKRKKSLFLCWTSLTPIY